MTSSDPASPAPRRSFAGKILYALRVLAINFLIFAVLAEVVSLILVHRHNWPASRPSYRLAYNSFWTDINPAFGVWHRSNGDYIHKGGCYNVEYFTNSYGARDVERSIHSAQPRTVVLGDSFVEGMGLPADERLTNILEKETGRPHLNFGTGGNFGPLQYELLYKTMAANFDHNLVIVGVLPVNDFLDMDPSYYKSIGQADRYRPYYANDFSVYYTGHFDPNAGESGWDRTEAFFRAYLASYHVGQYLYTRLYWRMLKPYSGYNDYTDTDFARLQRALLDTKSIADAHGARLGVFLIPTLTDFIRFHEGQNRLGPALEAWGREVGIPVLDLLPQQDADSHGDYRSYFLPCDGHWSYKGNQEAAKILEPWLYGTPAAPRSGPLLTANR
jgi:hypothetical protein